MKNIIIDRVIAFVMLIFTYIYFGYRIFYKKSIMTTLEEDEKRKTNPLVVEWKTKYKATLERIMLLILSCYFLLTTIVCIIPFCKDLPYILKGNYPSFEGEVVNEYESSHKNGDRTPIIIKSQNRILKISVHNDNIQKGDYVKVIYLPNIGSGVVTSYVEGGKRQ